MKSKSTLPLLLLALAFAAGGTPLHAQGTGLVVTSSNNVGIGTTNPDSTLTVAGDAHFQRSGGSSLYIQSPSSDVRFFALTPSGGSQNILFNPGGGNIGIGTINPTRGVLHVAGGRINLEGNSGDSAAVMTLGNATYPTAQIVTPYSGGTLSLAGASGNGILINSSGKVGVGTTSPSDNFHIYGSGNSGALLVETGHVNNTWLRIKNNSSGGRTWSVNSSGQSWPGGGGSFFIYDETVGAERVRIDTSGNVGIGMSSPGYKLDVAGSVHATSFVSATTTYADFVFKPGYKLEPLSQIEAAIKEDGHLPGIPSEEEAKAHGIDLAQMQVKLLQKIEELTLHQIEQEKRIDQLEKENTELRAKIKP
ncbi:MAG TPA: hypothetical protein VFB27_02650 [Opitutaceae bacterium]|nr:hypothetical protein [Opitutaceae bacterium]